MYSTKKPKQELKLDQILTGLMVV